jgi:hypothetical protein
MKSEIYIILERESWEILGIESIAYASQEKALNYLKANWPKYFSEWTDEVIAKNFIRKVCIDWDN